MKRSGWSAAAAVAVVALLAPLTVAAQSETPAPAKAEPSKAQTAKETPSGTMKPTAAMKHHQGTKHVSIRRVDLNAAKAAELEKLPGVDEKLADAIIAARPIKNGDELVSRKVLTQGEWNKLQKRVTFGPAMSKSESKMQAPESSTPKSGTP